MYVCMYVQSVIFLKLDLCTYRKAQCKMIIRVELYLFPECGTNVITRRMLYTLGLANLATPSSHPCSQVYSVDHCAAQASILEDMHV